MAFNVIDSKGPLSSPRNWSAKRMHTDIISGEISIFSTDAELENRYGASFALDCRVVFSEMAHFNGCLVVLDDTGISDDDPTRAPKIIATCPVRGEMDLEAIKGKIHSHVKAYRNALRQTAAASDDAAVIERRVTCYRMPMAEYDGQSARFFASRGDCVGSLQISVK